MGSKVFSANVMAFILLVFNEYLDNDSSSDQSFYTIYEPVVELILFIA